jgi:HPt (histidine-containing phosphotransfer) domain-containing protein
MKEQNHLNSAALSELQEVMEEEFTILLETFLHDGKDRILQLLDAVQKGDADAFGRAAHSFKGSCTNIGIPYLAELCLEAEMRGKEGRMEGNDALVGQIRAEFAVVSSMLSDYL